MVIDVHHRGRLRGELVIEICLEPHVKSYTIYLLGEAYIILYSAKCYNNRILKIHGTKKIYLNFYGLHCLKNVVKIYIST